MCREQGRPISSSQKGFRVEELQCGARPPDNGKRNIKPLHAPLGEPFKTSTMTTTLTLTAAAPGTGPHTSLGPCNYTCYTDDVIGDSLIHACRKKSINRGPLGLNTYDGCFASTAPQNHVVIGVSSIHDNGAE